MNVIQTKYFCLDWSPSRSDGRRFKMRHNKRVSSWYVQVLALEISGWYR